MAAILYTAESVGGYMQTATRALQGTRSSGAPLPRVDALTDLYDSMFRWLPRRGQMMMVAGQPGSQKSGLALWYVECLKVPALYFSMDMAQHTASTRLASILTGASSEKIAEESMNGHGWYYAEALEESQISFCFDSSPTLEDMYAEINAYVEVYDRFPHVIVVDNLMDVMAEGEMGHQSDKALLLEFKNLARVTGAAVIVLHHASESSGNPLDPPARKFVINKASQTPEIILTVGFNSDTGEFKVAFVKQRNAPSDPGAENPVSLRADPDRTTFSRWLPRAAPVSHSWEYAGD